MIELEAGTRTLDVEREEVICRRCGLVYQQQTAEYTDEMLHAMCPRCQLVHSLSA